MAKVSTAKNVPIARWVTPEGIGWVIRSDRSILRNEGSHWKLYTQLPEDENLGDYVRKQMQKIPEGLHGKNPPVPATLERWAAAGYSRTPDNCKVDLTGKCSHGFWSYHVLYGLINPDEDVVIPKPTKAAVSTPKLRNIIWMLSTHNRLIIPRTKQELRELLAEEPHRLMVQLRDGTTKLVSEMPAGQYLVEPESATYKIVLVIEVRRRFEDQE